MPAIHDLVQVALLVVMTIFSVGRWVQTREDKETDATDDAAVVAKDLAAHQKSTAEERAEIWKEIDRQRRRWHDDLTPWRQSVAERLARFEEHDRSQDSQITQLWAFHERRGGPRT